jgi:hypothetical protein
MERSHFVTAFRLPCISVSSTEVRTGVIYSGVAANPSMCLQQEDSLVRPQNNYEMLATYKECESELKEPFHRIDRVGRKGLYPRVHTLGSTMISATSYVKP